MWIPRWVAGQITEKLWSGTPADNNQPAVPAEKQEILEDDSAVALTNSVAILARTESTSAAILAEFDRQEDKIDDMNDGLDQLEYNQARGQKSITNMKYGLLTREKEPQYAPQKKAATKRGAKSDAAQSPPKPVVVKEKEGKIDYESRGLGGQEEALAMLSTQLGGLNMQARLMGDSIKSSHEKLKKVKTRVVAADDKNKDLNRQMKGMGKK